MSLSEHQLRLLDTEASVVEETELDRKARRLDAPLRRPKPSHDKVVRGKTLPKPPTDIEKYTYLAGPQQRWLMPLAAGAFLMVLISMGHFAMSARILRPFLLLVAFLLISTLVGAYTSSRKRRITLKEHLETVETYKPDVYPSVDILLPNAGECLELLNNTFKHVSELNWPGELKVTVLDDYGRDEVRTLAEIYGFIYLSRPNRGEMKKAGNLLYGYKHTQGDFIAVFDADFSPRSDFLTELMPYTRDGDLGIVQSPQYFGVTDDMNWLERGAGATQELFYRWVQPSRDRSRAPICVGTNAIYRREGLEKAGGFAQIGHSEDVHTGVNLRKAGYFTRYIPVNVAKGSCPDDLAAFTNQQYRWCTGSMSLLLDPDFHKLKLGLKAKLSFTAGFFYYLATAALVLAAGIPTLLMLWLFPYAIHPSNYLPLLPAFLVVWFLIPHMLKTRWGPEVLRVQMVYSFSHAVAIWDIARDRTMGWVATGAGGSTPLSTRVRRLMAVWVAGTALILWSGVARDLYLGYSWNLLPIAILGAIQAFVAWPILFPVPEAGRKRNWLAATLWGKG